MKPLSLSGQTFGRLLVIDRAPSVRTRSAWNVQCQCGEFGVVIGKALVSGHTQSCGCIQREKLRARNTSHGGYGSRLYVIWRGMRARCENPNHIRYDCYGGRGIQLCYAWRKSFKAFRSWALSHGYRDDLTIDRIDVDGNYRPENCRWATDAEQNGNRRPFRREPSFA